MFSGRTTASIAVYCCVFGFCAALCGAPPASDADAPKRPGDERPSTKKNGAADEGPLDEVELNDGRVIRGIVLDAGGPTIRIKRKLGSVTVMKSDIKRCTFARDARREREEDEVHLRDGRILKGRVEVDTETGRVAVTRMLHGERQKVWLDPAEVLRIKKGGAPLEPDLIEKEAADLVGVMVSGTEEEAKKAEERLVSMGMFAVETLKRLRLSQPVRVQKRITHILRVAELNRYLTPKMTEEVKDVYERLLDGSPRQKVDVVKELVLVEGEAAVPLLLHLARRREEDARVRAICVAMLAKTHRYAQLADLLESEDGRLRFAAALALADEGVYAGAEQLLSALKMGLREVRGQALERLKRLAGTDFGFDPSKDPAGQTEALDRWRAWWRQNSGRVLKDAAKQLTPAAVSGEDREFSAIRAAHAAGLMERGRLEGALREYRRAARIDPSNTRARLAVGVLTYVVEHDYKKARAEMMRLLSAYDLLTDPVRRETRYWLGQMALEKGDWKEALHQFQVALFTDAAYIPAYEGLARALLQQLRGDPLMAGDEVGREVLHRRATTALRVALAYMDRELNMIRDVEFRVSLREAHKELGALLGRSIKVRTDEDIASYERLLVAHKAHLYERIAEVEMAFKRYGDAVDSLQEAAICQPNNAYYLYRLGLVHAMSGDNAAARDAFKKALAKNPDLRQAREALDALEGK